MTTTTDTFTFPRTRKSKAGKAFIKEVSNAQAGNDLTRLCEQTRAEIERLEAIIHDQQGHDAAAIIDAQMRLPIARKFSTELYFSMSNATRESYAVYAQRHLIDVIELATEEVFQAAQDELAELRKNLPKGVTINSNSIESPAVAAHRQLTQYADQNGQARYLHEALTA